MREFTIHHLTREAFRMSFSPFPGLAAEAEGHPDLPAELAKAQELINQMGDRCPAKLVLPLDDKTVAVVMVR